MVRTLLIRSRIRIRNTNPTKPLYIKSVIHLKPRLPDSGSTLVDQFSEDGLHVVHE
jgi:hypothetical protein